MKKIIASLATCLLLSAVMPVIPASSVTNLGAVQAMAAESSPFLTPEQAQQKIKEDSSLFLLDVRSPEEYAERHLKGAMSIPLPELPSRVAELPADRPILIYCRSGKRASNAYEVVKKARPELSNVFVIRGFPIY